ncbi:hypothetical protein ACFQJ7_04295 [Halovenus rubra]|uniref:Uncharacterized protein n=2 Tax=Halovenus rubra TaxID=869890 RepID=A0ABD5X7W7_9EURY|nr:hypothetical protein [Halovenus rubra]
MLGWTVISTGAEIFIFDNTPIYVLNPYFLLQPIIGVWLTTIATVAFAVLLLHRFLHREKREALRNLEDELHNYIENPWEVRNYSIQDGATEEVKDLRQRINQVSSTREYPATFSIWTQLLLSVVIPKVLQLFLAST